MKELVLLAGGVYGLLTVVLGAFGAHLLKERLSQPQLFSLETGLKYQMYHALLLLIFGHLFDFDQITEYVASWSILIGIALFSFSIYGLIWANYREKNLKFLGPVTPLG